MKCCFMKIIRFFDENRKSPLMILFIIGGIAAFAFFAIKFTKKKGLLKQDVRSNKREQFARKPVEKSSISSRGVKEE